MFTLIEDTSYYTTEIINKLPSEHIATHIKRCFFKLEKSSDVQLVIEGSCLDDNTTFNKKNNYNINPTDIYFELSNNNDINNALVKKEIIVFLSLLNNIVI